jgi:DNA-binding NtrC family response regulator
VTVKASVVLVDDDAVFRHVMAGEVARLGYTVATAESGAEAIRTIADTQPQIVLLDLQLPDMTGLDVLKVIRERSPGSEVIMLTGHGSIDSAIESIKIGAFDYVAKPCPLDEIEVRLYRALEQQRPFAHGRPLERGLTPPDLRNSFVGESPAFRGTLRLIDQVAPTDSTVLIAGETGTGKELVAKLIHARSHRRDRPFVVVQCAALQESLLQSELFGHERGAFTGADRAKPGLFEVANGGTMFLDEIGEVSPSTQVTLLRVLDSGTFRHVGGTTEIRVDVRVLAATNRDLTAMVRQGSFREDLFFRLSTMTVELPPLRSRGADVELLARHCVALINARFGSHKSMTGETVAALMRHDWPGNVRELLHAIEAAMVVCDNDRILPDHLPKSVRAPRAIPIPAAGSDDQPGLPTLVQMEREHMKRALDATDGHRGQAARILGISERNLYRKLREHGLLT